MRSIPAALQTALASGSPQPYLRGSIGYRSGATAWSGSVLAYRLGGTRLGMHIPYDGDMASDLDAMWLERGISNGGVTSTITTSRFYITRHRYLPDRTQWIEGELFPARYYSASGYASYSSVINAFCSAFGFSAAFKDAGEAWLGYAFMPAGSTLRLADARRISALLQQKRLVRFFDDGGDAVKFYSADAWPGTEVTLTIADVELVSTTTQPRQYLWRDEAGAYHQSGSATSPVHNLGYLESTASPPARTWPLGQFRAVIRPDLRLQDGDRVRIIRAGDGSALTGFAQVTEEYDPAGAAPHWRMLLESNPVFTESEGGLLPEGVTAAGNYLPVNTASFAGVLSFNDTNLQQALVTLDGHTHTAPVLIGWGLQGITVPGAGTRYLTPFNNTLASTAYAFRVPFACTARNLVLATAGASPAGGTLTATLIVNGSASALGVVVPASSAAGAWSDSAHAVTLAAGDLVYLSLVNTSASASAVLRSVSMDWVR